MCLKSTIQDAKVGEVPPPSPGSALLTTRTFRMDEDFVRRMNNAIAACAGHPLYLTQTGFVHSWLRKGVEHLERQYNGGQPFPDAPPLPRGRRAGR